MKLLLAAAATCLLLGTSVRCQTPADQSPNVPSLTWGPCDTAPAPFECATAQVPRDYANPAGDTIDLAVIRHPATDPANRIGALFFNPGGPGGPGTTDLPLYFSQFPDAAVARFDIISWDPRGVGLSTALQCFPNQDAETAFFAGVPSQAFPLTKSEQTAWIRRFAEFGRICGQRQGDLLAHFSTADTARDMDLLRQAVGEARINYLGVSYGTYLGAVYANLFPDKIRAAVLDGVVDPVAYNAQGNSNPGLSTGQRLGSDIAVGQSLSAFLDLCGQRGPAVCAFAAEDAAATHAKFDNLIASLQAAPVDFKKFSFTPALLLTTANSFLFFTRPVPEVSGGWIGLASLFQDIWMLTQQAPAAPGTTAPAGPADPATPSDAEEKYTSPFQQAAVECPESPNPSPAGVFRKLARLTIARAGLIGLSTPWTDEICTGWPAAAADAYTGPWNNPTSSTLLVVGNTHDPSTPYVNAVAAAQELANARLLTVKGYGHTALLNASACEKGYVDAYLVDGALPPPGTVCQQDAPPF